MSKKLIILSFFLSFSLMSHWAGAVLLVRELREFDYFLGKWEGYWAEGELNKIEKDKPKRKVTCYALPTSERELIQILLYEPSESFPSAPKDSCLSLWYSFSFPHYSRIIKFADGMNPNFKQSNILFAAQKFPWEITHRFYGGSEDRELSSQGYHRITTIKPLSDNFQKICFSQEIRRIDHPNDPALSSSVLVLNKVMDLKDTKTMLKAYLDNAKILDNDIKESNLYNLLKCLPVDLEEQKSDDPVGAFAGLDIDDIE